MAFRVFLSHSLDPTEQALAWRLQTLAVAHGVEMYVPRREAVWTSRTRGVTAEVQSAIDRSDCVLAIITTRADALVQNELKYALAKNKLVIPIVSEDVADHPLLAKFPRVFKFLRWGNPGQLEREIAEFLKQQRLSKEKTQAIGALVAVGVGLLLLFSLSEK